MTRTPTASPRQALDSLNTQESANTAPTIREHTEKQRDPVRESQSDKLRLWAQDRDLDALTPLTLFTLDTGGRIRDVNEKAAALLGYVQEQLVHAPLSRFIASEDQDAYTLFLCPLEQQATPCCMLRLHPAQGFPIWVRVEGQGFGQDRFLQVSICDVSLLMQTEEGQRIAAATVETGTGTMRAGVSGVIDPSGLPTAHLRPFQNIPEQTTLAPASAVWHDRFRALFQGALNSMLLLNDQGRYLDVNPAACHMLGYSREELLTLNETDIKGPRERRAQAVLSHRLIDERRETGRIKLRHRLGHEVIADYASVTHIQPGVHLCVMSDVSAQVAAELALQEAQQRLRNFGLKQQEAFEELCSNLARDLHDQLGQTLSVLKLEVDMLQHQAPNAAQRMHALIKDSMGAVRDLSRTLRPVVLDLGLSAALQSTTQRIALSSDVDIETHIDPEIPTLCKKGELALYRIAQEALSNATQHARAEKIRVSLCSTNGQLVLEVVDNGIGFSPPEAIAHNGLGLIGMRERANLLDAQLVIESAPGQGCLVRLTLAVHCEKTQP
jgi:PAS domain S-box-containing protein